MLHSSFDAMLCSGTREIWEKIVHFESVLSVQIVFIVLIFLVFPPIVFIVLTVFIDDKLNG